MMIFLMERRFGEGRKEGRKKDGWKKERER